jgi:hypothetical protein
VAGRTLVIVIGVSLSLVAACRSSASPAAREDTSPRPNSTVSTSQSTTSTSTSSSHILVDCINAASRSAAACPKPGEGPRTEATLLTCMAELDPTNPGLPILRAKLTLAGGGQALAGQLVRWELPDSLHGVGGRPDATTNGDGVATLAMAAKPGPVNVSSVIVARFTDPPPHTGRYNVLGDAQCSVTVQIQRSG